MTRKQISTRTRFEVFKRDGFKCQYCGAHPPEAMLHVDHIEAVANGGSNDMDNLITSCAMCNLGKSCVPLSSVPQSLAEKAAEVAEREEQLRGYSQILEAKRQRLEEETWRVMELLYPGEESVPRDSFNGTRKFIERLGFHSVYEAAEIALAGPAHWNRTFRYFCGVCWTKIREMEGGK